MFRGEQYPYHQPVGRKPNQPAPERNPGMMAKIRRNKVAFAALTSALMFAGGSVYLHFHDNIEHRTVDAVNQSESNIETEQIPIEVIPIYPSENSASDSRTNPSTLPKGDIVVKTDPLSSDTVLESDTTFPLTIDVAALNVRTSGTTPGTARMRTMRQFFRDTLHEPDIGMLQEVSHRAQFRTVKKLFEDEYQLYPNKVEDNGKPGIQGRTIVYKRLDYTVLERSSIKLPKRNKPTDPVYEAVTPVLVLEHKDSGQQIIIINMHPSAYKTGAALRAEGSKRVRETVIEYKKKYPDATFIVGGDMNELERVSLDGPGKTLNDNEDNLFYQRTCGVLEHGFDAAHDLKGCKRQKATSIEALYVGGDDNKDVHWYKVVPAGMARAGTDHANGVEMRVTMR